MTDINRYICTGRLTRDPELRSTNSGMEILNIGLAVNDRKKVSDKWEDAPNFLDCKMFGTRAARVAGMLSKGMKVTIEGKLSYSTWKGDDGRNRSKIEVLIDNIDWAKQEPAGCRESVENSAGSSLYAEDIPF